MHQSAEKVIPGSHLHVKPSRQSHTKKYSLDEMGCDNLVAVTGSYAVVTPLRKAASYEPRIAIFGI